MIPPGGPSPGPRSAMHSMPICEYLAASPMIRTGASVAVCKVRQSRAISGSPSNSTSALSRPNRRLAPPASTNPSTRAAPLLPVTSHQSQVTLQNPPRTLFRVLHRLAARPPNPALAQFFLQALPMQADRRRCTRHIPSMARKLLRQVRDLELVLRFTKIVLAEPYVGAFVARLTDKRLAGRDFLRQIGDADLIAAAKHQAAFQCILEFAHVARPIISLDPGQGFAAEPRGSAKPCPMHLQKLIGHHRNIFLVLEQRRQ